MESRSANGIYETDDPEFTFVRCSTMSGDRFLSVRLLCEALQPHEAATPSLGFSRRFDLRSTGYRVDRIDHRIFDSERAANFVFEFAVGVRRRPGKT